MDGEGLSLQHSRLHRSGLSKREVAKQFAILIQMADPSNHAQAVMLAKGWDATDKAMVTSVSYRITHVLTAAERTGKFRRVGKRAGANLWVLKGA